MLRFIWHVYLYKCNIYTTQMIGSVYMNCLILALIGVRTFFWVNFAQHKRIFRGSRRKKVDLGVYFPPEDLSTCIFFVKL